MFSSTIIVGNLGRAPELRYTRNGTPVMNATLCSTEVWYDEDGKHTHDEWHRIVMFGKSAEMYGKKLGKGDCILIEGQNRTREWTDSKKIKRYTTEVVARKIRRIVIRKNKDVPAHLDDGAPMPEK